MRPSGTEPLVRLMVEAPSDEECERILALLVETAEAELSTLLGTIREVPRTRMRPNELRGCGTGGTPTWRWHAGNPPAPPRSHLDRPGHARVFG